MITGSIVFTNKNMDIQANSMVAPFASRSWQDSTGQCSITKGTHSNQTEGTLSIAVNMCLPFLTVLADCLRVIPGVS